MTIILTGGGSGGHITPVLAVANELKKSYPEAHLIYIGQRGDSLADIPQRHPAIDKVYTVRAGKFRRYHNGLLRQLFDFLTIFKNTRDFFFVIIGIFQSMKLLKKINPDVVFIRGGFVGVPVGLAAARRHVPYITHDSDALPSLANRIVGKWASAHAVAMSKHTYPYEQDKTFQIGVPVDSTYKPVDKNQQQEFKEELGINPNSKVLLVTGGGLGAQRLNESIIQIVPLMFDEFKDLVLLHLTGRKNFEGINDHYAHTFREVDGNKIIVKGFVNDLYRYSGAADLIICRAGATNLAEFALQRKACIVVPNPHLTGGHQLKNSQELEKSKSILVVDEEEVIYNPNLLWEQVKLALNNSDLRDKLGKNLSNFARPQATKELADLIVKVAAKD